VPRTFKLIVVSLLLASAVACKKKPLSISTTAYILGPQSLISVITPREQSEIDPRVLNASVLISTRLGPSEVKFCSGTLIPSDLVGGNLRVVANHHCFAEVDSEGIAIQELLPEACIKTKVYLGFFAGQSESSTITECLPGSLRTTLDGDLSVFRLASKVPDQFQPLSLADPNTNLAGRQALIVHYPDIKSAKVASPDGGPKLPLAQVTRERCKIIGNFPIGHWQFDRSLPFSIKHTCDLTHGSSGSGLIDAATGQLIGVNWGGIKINDNGQTETVNVATSIGFVDAFLNFNTSKLEHQAAGALAAADLPSASKDKGGGVLHATGITKSLSCGVVGSRPDDTTSLGWVILAATPVIGMILSSGLWRRRRTKFIAGMLTLVGALLMPHQDAEASPAVASDTVASDTVTPNTVKVSPAPGWGTAYLLSAVFLAEYDSLVAYDRAAASVMKRERPLHTNEWLRAHAALGYLKAQGIKFPEMERLADQVAMDPAARAHAQFIGSFKSTDAASLQTIAATFKASKWAESWPPLSVAFMAPVPKCASSDPATMSCVPSQTTPSGQESTATADTLALNAGIQVAQRHYAEALALLVGLVERDPSFRLPYELVQRAYSWRQRGSGKVAIQGL